MTRLLKIVLVLTALAAILSSTAWADTKEHVLWERYKADSDPGTHSLSDTVYWEGPLQPYPDSTGGSSLGLLTNSIDVAGNTSIWLGMDNLNVDYNITYLELYLRGTGLDSTHFKLIDTGAADTLGVYGVSDGKRTTGVIMKIREWHSDAINILFYFAPQPSWKVVKFTTVGNSATITHFYTDFHCRVPSLTQYGLGVLVLLLIAAAFLVYRHRRRVIA